MQSPSPSREKTRVRIARFVGRVENLLVLGGVLATAIGIALASRDVEALLACSCIVLGISLVSGLAWRRVGWVLATAAVLLFVVSLFT